MILKVIKRNKEERILDYFMDNNGNFNPEISVNDTIYFICNICNKEDSCRKNTFNNTCSSCKRKQTKLEKYNDPNYNNRDKVKQTFLEKYGWKKEKKVKDEKKTQEKRKQTFLEKYGVENPNQIKQAQEKSKQTRLEKYNSFNNFEKIKQTNLKKYGVEYVFQNEEVKEKIKQTNLKKYGVEYYTQSNEYKEKAKQTNILKYGFEYVFQNEEVKEKIRKTMVDKYGEEHALKNKDILNKLKQTNLNNIGVEYYFQLKECIELSKKAMFENLKVFKQENIVPLFSYEEYINTHISNRYSFKCKICNTVFEDHLDNGRIPRCPTCFPSNRSKGEIELANFLKEHIDIIENDRELIKPYEIDILIPSLNLAIEYNGEFWHTDDQKELMKKELVEEKGYGLIIIWDKNWNNNKEEIKKDLLESLPPQY